MSFRCSPKIAIIPLLGLMLLLAACGPNQDGIVKHSSIFQEAEVTRVMVSVHRTPIYPGLSTDLPALDLAPDQAVYQVVGKVDEWYVVLLENRQLGCIEKANVVPYIEGKNTEVNQHRRGALSAQEQTMLDLINEERLKAGLKPLMLDLQLTQLARMKSQDLVDYSYFSHYSPTYGNPFEMLEQQQIDYVFAGENLAGNKDVRKAHEELMNSDTHRQNILHPAFTHVGIGVVKGGPYGYIYTQLYIGI